jgi:DNA topoisomerase-1
MTVKTTRSERVALARDAARVLKTSPPGLAAGTPDPTDSAASAGLHYVNDAVTPGIRRLRARNGFRYVSPKGEPVRDRKTLARIKALVIPPAWTDVWICPYANGHLQATGRDQRGRKQYRYHDDWRRVRDGSKFDRMVEFGRALPAVRERVRRDMALPGLPRQKVLATLVRLLESSLARVGNEEYARANGTFGLTTLREEHVEVDGARVRFTFPGKRGIEHVIDIRDRRVANIVRRMQDLPGQELFTYLDEGGQPRDVGSQDVNDYLREVTGHDFTAKDFRTFAGTVLAAEALRNLGLSETEAQAKRNAAAAVKAVAAQLRNTPAVCRKAYVHPAVIQAYMQGVLVGQGSAAPDGLEVADALSHLRPNEEVVLTFLQVQVSEVQ